MILRQLNSSDQSSILDLFNRNTTLFKKQIEIPAYQSCQYIIEQLENDSNQTYTAGVFKDNELVGILCSFRWSKLPYYTLRGLKTLNQNKSVREYIKIFDLLLTHILKVMEGEGRYDFYFLNYQRNFHRNLFENQNGQQKIPRYFSYAKRYQLSVQEVIKPGHVSKYAAFNNMMGYIPSNTPIWIRRGSLIDPFRNELINRMLQI